MIVTEFSEKHAASIFIAFVDGGTGLLQNKQTLYYIPDIINLRQHHCDDYKCRKYYRSNIQTASCVRVLCCPYHCVCFSVGETNKATGNEIERYPLLSYNCKMTMFEVQTRSFFRNII